MRAGCVVLAACALLVIAGAGSAAEISGRLAFAAAGPGGDLDLWVARADGTAPRRVTALRTDEFSPSWSPDGSRIAYRVNPPRSDRGDLWVMDADGAAKRNLTRSPGTAEWSPAWSPAGDRIAYFSSVEGGDVWTMRPDGTDRRNLTRGSSFLSEYPTWSPDGARIAFNDHRDGNFEIYAMAADGSGQTNLTNNRASDEWPSWSPDGSKIAFRSQRDGNGEIYVMNADGSEPVNVTRTPSHEDFPAWTPDGRLGFVCQDGGLCVANADGSGRVALNVEAGFPAWTRTDASSPRPAGELVPTEAVAGIIEAFERHPLVAVSEEHGNAPLHVFLRSLVRDPSFPEVVDDVVGEFGNARDQRLVDRYLLEGKATLAATRRAWLQTSQGRVWWQPMYEQFFTTVRAVNRSLPRAKRIRVVLGDPPFDPARARSGDYYERIIGQRATHYIAAVERHVLAKDRHALLIAGGGHLLRGHENEAQVLERRHPGSTFVILPHFGFDGPTDPAIELERRLAAAGQAPWLAPLAGTWLAGVVGPLAEAYLYLGRP